MERIAGGAGMIDVADIRCSGLPDGVRLCLVTGPAGADRRDLRRDARRQVEVLAGELVAGVGGLVETARGPIGAGAWQHLGVSLAYAGNRALVAVACGWRVGVDLLIDEAIPDWPAVAALYLRQAAEVERLPAAQRSSAYAAAWVALEAELKCLELPLCEGWSPDADPTAVRVLPRIPGCVAAVVLRPRAAVGCMSAG